MTEDAVGDKFRANGFRVRSGPGLPTNKPGALYALSHSCLAVDLAKTLALNLPN